MILKTIHDLKMTEFKFFSSSLTAMADLAADFTSLFLRAGFLELFCAVYLAVLHRALVAAAAERVTIEYLLALAVRLMNFPSLLKILCWDLIDRFKTKSPFLVSTFGTGESTQSVLIDFIKGEGMPQL